MTQIDLCIIAGRRPALLKKTLASFSKNMFNTLELNKVYVNIDPIFGDEDNANECVDIVKEFRFDAIIFQPEEPNFCAAVKRLWAKTNAEFVLHLEDDWIVLTEVKESALKPFENNSIMQVSFHSASQNWDVGKNGNFHARKEKKRFLGIKFKSSASIPLFSTSPSLLRGTFARKSALLMNDKWDPEKQFYSGVNVELERFAAPFKKYIFSPNGAPIIEGIGRLWRDERGIKKEIINSNPVWK